MQGASEESHAAIVAWIEGALTPAQRQAFEAHIATCPECQAQVAALLRPKPPSPVRVAARRILIGVAGVLVLGLGYALGLWIWQLAHQP